MENNKISAMERSLRRRYIARTTKIGAYTFAICAVLLAVIIVINLLVGIIPSKLTVFDTSPNKLYTVSDETTRYLGKLKEDITLYWICQDGIEDEILSKFLGNYIDISSRIKLKIIDPVKDPTVLDSYVSSTSQAPSNFSIIVESQRRHTIVDYLDMVYFYNQLIEETYGVGTVPSEVYEAYYQLYFYAEQSGSATEQYFYGDDAITHAIEYVTLENIPHIYVVEGHGEDTFSESFKGFAAQGSLSLDTLRLDTADAVPADANCIVIFSPTEDLSADDAQKIRTYLKQGGNMLLITDRTDVDHQNLLSLMADYGMTAAPGIVYEGSANGYKNSPNYLCPTPDSEHLAVAYATQAKYAIHTPNAHAIIIDENVHNVTPILTTSDSAYIMNDDQKSQAGQYAVGAAVSKETDGGTTQIVWYSSAEAFTDSIASGASYGNYYYLFYSMAWMNETYESGLTTIKGPSLAEPMLDGLTASSALTWAVIFVFIFPGIILTVGLVIWIRRKKN